MFRNVKVGDMVIRNLCGIEMPLYVTAVEEGKIVCGLWDFNPDNGFEIDLELGWDGITRTGSVLTQICLTI